MSDVKSSSEHEQKIRELYDLVLKKGGYLSRRDLAVLVLGGNEMVFGEVDAGLPELVGGPVKVLNPKRLVRLQMMAQGGLSISYLLGDFDHVSTGYAYVQAVAGYKLDWVDLEAQANILGLFLDYIERQAHNRAVERGIILPDTKIQGVR